MDEKTVGDNWRPKARGKRGAPCQYSDIAINPTVYSLPYRALEELLTLKTPSLFLSSIRVKPRPSGRGYKRM